MARRCSKKSYRSQKFAGGLNRIPKDLLTEILSHVASASCSDLFSAQQTCKSLHEAGSDNYVLAHTTMKQFEFVNWNAKKSFSMAFLNRLKQSGNPEALFRLGMIDYFSKKKAEDGLQILKRAAEKGHALAMYVYGVILVCYGGSDRENGVKILRYLEKKGKSRDMVVSECRKQIKLLVRQLWINNCIVGSGPDDENSMNQVCENGCILRRNKKGWRTDDEVNSDDCCNSCFWDREGREFRNMLLKGVKFLDLLSYTKLIINTTQQAQGQRCIVADPKRSSCKGPDVSLANPTLYKNFIKVLCNANSSEEFEPKRDVPLPEIYLTYGSLGSDYVGQAPRNRPILAFFEGRAHGYVRELLFKHWKDKDKEILVAETLPVDGKKYRKMVGRTKFCLWV